MSDHGDSGMRDDPNTPTRPENIWDGVGAFLFSVLILAIMASCVYGAIS